MADYKRRSPRRQNEPYQERSNAICITIYDIHGQAVTDDIVAHALNVVTEITDEHRGLAISFTRT